MLYFFLSYVFEDNDCLCSSRCPESSSVDLEGLKLRDLPDFVSQMLGLRVGQHPGFCIFIFWWWAWNVGFCTCSVCPVVLCSNTIFNLDIRQRVSFMTLMLPGPSESLDLQVCDILSACFIYFEFFKMNESFICIHACAPLGYLVLIIIKWWLQNPWALIMDSCNSPHKHWLLNPPYGRPYELFGAEPSHIFYVDYLLSTFTLVQSSSV